MRGPGCGQGLWGGASDLLKITRGPQTCISCPCLGLQNAFLPLHSWARGGASVCLGPGELTAQSRCALSPSVRDACEWLGLGVAVPVLSVSLWPWSRASTHPPDGEVEAQGGNNDPVELA